MLRPYLAQTVRGYLVKLGPEEERYIRSFDGLNEIQVDRRLIAESLTSMVRFPTRTAVRIIKNTIKYWDPHHDPDLIHRYRSYNLAYGIIAPFMVWGIILSFPQRRRFMLLYVTIIATWMISALFIHLERYRLPVETIGLIFASSAVIALFRRPGKPWVPWAVIGVVVLINVLLMTLGCPILHSIRETIRGIR